MIWLFTSIVQHELFNSETLSFVLISQQLNWFTYVTSSAINLLRFHQDWFCPSLQIYSPPIPPTPSVNYTDVKKNSKITMKCDLEGKAITKRSIDKVFYCLTHKHSTKLSLGFCNWICQNGISRNTIKCELGWFSLGGSDIAS